ncbi:MAG: hypothetical protein EXS05_11280 [Planctomycetaceae bacterium]|nr:hypothetical protein [Planctomycetaceae bacterium]
MAMPALNEDRLLANGAAPGRECDDCTVCCALLAQAELRKPMRRACDHACRNGCAIYETRPQGCRDFHCLWLRGALPADLSYRPDRLGVLFDGYRPVGAGHLRLVALEAWNDAFDGSAARELIDAIAQERPLELSYRDGSWQTRGPVSGEGQAVLRRGD